MHPNAQFPELADIPGTEYHIPDKDLLLFVLVLVLVQGCHDLSVDLQGRGAAAAEHGCAVVAGHTGKLVLLAFADLERG